MILSKNGLKKRMVTLRKLVKNNKIECIIFFIGVVVIFCILIFKNQEAINTINQLLKNYLNENRISLITSIMAIFIGIYIAMLTCIAASKISITEVMLKNKLDQDLSAVIIFGIIEDFILLFLGIFIPIKALYIQAFFLLLLIMTIISFIKFIILMYYLYKLNIDAMVKEIDKENNEKVDLITKICELLDKVNNIKK